MINLLLLILLIIILALYLLWLLANIRNISKQLEFLVKTDSNKELFVSTNSHLLRKLVENNNHLIKKYKHNAMSRNLERDELQAMISNILHDIRTPLTVASGYAQVLKDKASNNGEQIDHIVESIESASGQLEHLYLISRVLENQNPTLEDLNISSLLQERFLYFYESLNSRGLAINIDLLENAFVHSNKDELVTLIDNLFSNLLGHGLTYCHINFRELDTKLVFEITNDFKEGKFDSSKALDRFYTTSPNGTGVGLFIVEKIAKRLDLGLGLDAKDGVFSVRVSFLKYHVRENK